MAKLEEMLAASKLNELIKRNEKEVAKEEKKCNVVVIVCCIVAAVVAVAGIAYAVYRYFTPDYLEEFDEDFEDEDFDDDFVVEDKADEEE